jgi:hypothetical protein
MRRLWLEIATLVASLLLVSTWFLPVMAQDYDPIRQYKAAFTRIFLWKYSALPIFRENPIFPGSVVQLSNETVYFAPDRCYDRKQGGQYRRIADYADGMAVSSNADLKIRGALLSNSLADIQAKAGVTFETSASMTVSPLSLDTFKPDAAALRTVKPSEECKLVLRTLDGEATGYVVAAEVLHGTLDYVLKLSLGAKLDASGRSKLLALISKTFALKETDVAVSADTAFFSVSAAAAPQTLAIVPERLSLEELARITNYLQGKRGSDLETAVNEALTASDAPTYQKVVNVIRGILGEEIKNKERWAERFVSGREMVPVSVLRGEY